MTPLCHLGSIFLKEAFFFFFSEWTSIPFVHPQLETKEVRKTIHIQLGDMRADTEAGHETGKVDRGLME